MTDLLDRSITSALAEIVAHAPDAGPSPTGVTVVLATPERSRRTLVLVAAVAVLGAAGVTTAVVSRGPATPAGAPDESGASTATVTTTPVLAPAATLPDGVDVIAVPVTVDAGSARTWYRLQPDLDVAWQGAGSSTEVCWRTPVADGCRPDGDLVPFVAPTAGGQTLVIVTWAGSDQPHVDVGLSDGTIQRAPIEWDRRVSLGVARLALPDGVTVASLGTARATPAAVDDDVSGATLPPAVDLADIPITVPAGAALSYWRFLPDLDIAERSSAASTELCWRTPAGTGCIPEAFNSPDVGIVPTDGAAIVLVWPALVPIDPPPSDPMAPKFEVGPTPTAVDITFSDGSTTSVAVRTPAEWGRSYARVDIPAGLTVAHAASH
ncbi:MAG: hypothetical protein QM733_13180 [Ilumatobacteraceae bacterium]